MSKVWFITGAGSGIGAATAKAALKAGDASSRLAAMSIRCAML
jgi:NAD(P)-dependent dehydrogenase (short-subunit alcohol dehydrogenase family)